MSRRRNKNKTIDNNVNQTLNESVDSYEFYDGSSDTEFAEETNFSNLYDEPVSESYTFGDVDDTEDDIDGE